MKDSSGNAYDLLVRDNTCSAVAYAGGKGASLARLTQAGFPVPPGFVVGAAAFDEFLRQNELNAGIEAVLKRVKHTDMNSVDRVSREIHAMLFGAPVSKKLVHEILIYCKKLKARYVAVRSSATAEDSTIASWARELETYLNVTEKDIIDSVKKCWVSLFTPRAIFYRFEKYAEKRGSSREPLSRNHAEIDLTSLESVSVAVVVQEMIASEVSGVCFTVHPVTKDKNQMVIEACFGLGEALVSGQITPDTYIVHKEDFSILDVNVSEQVFAIIQGKSGNVKKKLPASRGSRQKLTREQVAELAKMCKNIEQHYHHPQDIEWAYSKGKWHILQSRPITTI